MNIRINNNKFVVKTMITPKDKSNGMMGKKFTSPNQGMLFLMDEGEPLFLDERLCNTFRYYLHTRQPNN